MILKIGISVFVFLSICYGVFSQENPYKQGEIVALVYHRFGDDRYPSTNIKTQTFKRQLEYLKQNKYNVLTLSEACDKLYKGDGVKAKTVVITIDDGYKSFIENGFPLLKQYNFPATIFINTINVGNKDYMDWDDLGVLINSGMEIGNHSHSHLYFLNEDKEGRTKKLKEEINISQELFAEHLEYIPEIFSYPFGEYGKGMKEIVRDEGFKFAAAQHSGVISLFSDPYALPRFPMNERYGTLESFITKIQMHALPVIKIEAEGSIYKSNPPVLCLTLDPEFIDQSQIQCFVAGSTSCNMTITQSDNSIKVKVESQSPLTSRRSLYTITAPFTLRKGWCWYSYVWIDPQLNE